MISLATTPERGADLAGPPEQTDAAGRGMAGGAGPLVPQIINGRYRVVDTLGTGSLATVYLCDELATAKRVAVKVFQRAFGKDEEFVGRLRRQMRRAAALNESHPQVLAVSDCDRTPDGSPYIATEYLQGRTLRDVIRRGGPLEVRRALRLACQIADALDAIHKAGFVHTDVRPENVIIMSVGEEEVAKLKGFEVAGLRETALVEHMILAGVIPSNPEYGTPEQVDGDQVTPRTDIYAFGVVLYEMLSGRVPFAATSPDGVLAKHLQEPPAPLSSFQREIPSVVESRIKQALDKEPERRQRYVGDVVNEYLCELAAEEVLAERARRHGGMVGTLSAVMRWSLAQLSAVLLRGEPLGPMWKIAAALLVVLASAAAVWMFWPAWRPAQTAAPLSPAARAAPALGQEPPVRLDREPPPATAPVAAAEAPETPDGGVAAARLPEETTHSEVPDLPVTPQGPTVSRTPTAPKESSLRPPGMSTRPQQGARQPVPTGGPAQVIRKAAPAPVAAPPAVSRQQEAPTPARGTPDPTAIIDWLLGRPRGNE